MLLFWYEQTRLLFWYAVFPYVCLGCFPGVILHCCLAGAVDHAIVCPCTCVVHVVTDAHFCSAATRGCFEAGHGIFHRSEGFPPTGLFRPCVRLVPEASRFWELFASRRVRLSVFWRVIGVWLKRSVSFSGMLDHFLLDHYLLDTYQLDHIYTYIYIHIHTQARKDEWGTTGWVMGEPAGRRTGADSI